MNKLPHHVISVAQSLSQVIKPEAIRRRARDDELALRLSENGKRFVLKNFTLDKIGREVESVYREVIR